MYYYHTKRKPRSELLFKKFCKRARDLFWARPYPKSKRLKWHYQAFVKPNYSSVSYSVNTTKVYPP